MVIQSGDLGIEPDTGSNRPGQILQRLEPDGWRDYPFEGEVSYLMDLSQLPPGRYRLTESPV
jgi:hypothetical protein